MSQPIPDLPRDEGAPGAAAAPAAQPTAVAAVFATALRGVLLLLAVVAVVGVVVGWLVAGLPGVWGALLGAGITLVFCGTTVVSMQRTAHSSAQTMAAVVMGAWLAKVLVVLVVLAVVQRMDFYSRPVLAAVLAVGVVGSALVDHRAVTRSRLPYVEPGAAAR